MPDGDVVHSGPKGFYRTPYRCMSDGTASNEICARSMLRALKKDLQKKGNRPIELCQRIAEILDEAGLDCEESEREYAELNQNIDVLAREFSIHPYLKDVVLLASKQILADLRYGQDVHYEDIPLEILRRYVHGVYVLEFLERIPLNPEQHTGISLELLKERIEQIDPLVEDGINEFSKALAKHYDSARLSLPRRSSKQPIDLNEDLLAG
jgi:hypothetical protein